MKTFRSALWLLLLAICVALACGLPISHHASIVRHVGVFGLFLWLGYAILRYVHWCRGTRVARPLLLAGLAGFALIAFIGWQTHTEVTVEDAQTITGAKTFTGSNTTKNENTIRWVDSTNKAGWTGSTVDAWIAAAFTDCASNCTVQLASGTYTYSSSISLPIATAGPHMSLKCQAGVNLNYTGSGDAITAFGPNGESAVMALIDGCLVTGAASGVNGLHIKQFNHFKIAHSTFRNFSTGSGVFNEGGNQIICDDCEFDGNWRGWTDQSMFSGVRYDPNSVTFTGGTQFQNNFQWGWILSAIGNAGVGASIGSTTAAGTVFFNNGSNASAVTIAADNGTCALAGACRNAGGTVATFITSAAHGLTAGSYPDEVLIAGVTDATFNGFCTVTSIISSTSFTCSNTGTASAHSGTGTSQRITGEIFMQYGTSAAIDNTYLENSNSLTAPVCRVLIGDNNFQPRSSTIVYTVFNSVNATNSICVGNGLANSIQYDTENGIVTNFVNNIGTGTRQLTVGPVNAPSATNFFTGTNNGLDNQYVGATQGGPFASGDVNAQGTTIRGYGFNALSGLNQDLAIRTRNGGTNAVKFANASGGTQVGAVSDTGVASFNAYATATNCAVNSVSPAACGAAAAGAFVVPTTTTTYTVNTTAVTAASRIVLMPRTYTGDLPGTPTCTAVAVTSSVNVSAITAATSFTFILPSTAGQTCWNYWVVN